MFFEDPEQKQKYWKSEFLKKKPSVVKNYNLRYFWIQWMLSKDKKFKLNFVSPKFVRL